MAENLIFPVKFDLSKAVSDATGDLDATMRRLQTMINSRPLAVNLKIDGAGGSSINEINDRMKELSARWKELSEAQRITSKTSGEYTAEAKKIINEYVRLTGATQTYAKTLEQIAAAARRAADAQTRNIDKITKKQAEQLNKTRRTLSATENSIKNVTDKLKIWQNALNSRDVGTRQFERAAQEVQRLTKRLEELRQKTAEATGQEKKVDKVTDSFRKQETYVSRLIKRLAVYASFSAVGNFLTKIREVTAEFELQRVSLGAILQDTQKANQLFGQLKTLALQSPVKFLDLTKYTKQLAAYKIGYDELFETTKRLTDISVGLGVSMDRIILMYGQIRATGYLRACLGKDTLVKMFDGSFKAVQDITVGDLLMGDDEKPRKVSKLFHGKQAMYRVKYIGGEFKCNENHILTLYNIHTRKIENVYAFDVDGCAENYLGVKRINGKYEYFDFELIVDKEREYFGFSLDGNKRFVICDNIVTHNSEVRQATEAGIPLVEELAKKLSAMRGEMISAADVMDMISKRSISFELVKEVFDDMTSAGGIFYNMQEKQGNTLYGMWQKLGDAAAIMYDQIGNTSMVNGLMKGLIQTMTDMMKHWEALADAIKTSALAFGVYKAAMHGLIPGYNLHYNSIVKNIKAEKSLEATQLKKLSKFTALTTEQQKLINSSKQLTRAEWRRAIQEANLNRSQLISLARRAKNIPLLQEEIARTGQLTRAQVQQIGAMSRWQYMGAKLKALIPSIGNAFAQLGATLKGLWPVALITTIISQITGWIAASKAQAAAVAKVEKEYEETRHTLMKIENAYRDIQAAVKGAKESEEEFAKTTFSQKLEQLQKIIQLLGHYGMDGLIDVSALNGSNIDPVVDNWLEKLKEANDLTLDWGRQVANQLESFEWFWGLFGENLKSDMKDVEASWAKITANTKVNKGFEYLRDELDKMSNDNIELYNKISKALNMDAKLAMQQKRRNETELQYQKRIFENYMRIRKFLDSEKGWKLFNSGDVMAAWNEFSSDYKEVLYEFEKIKESFRGKEAISVKMAIDDTAAKNDWTSWQKEMLIDYLNQDPITLNAEIIPIDTSNKKTPITQGLKLIIKTEFPTLFTDDELSKLNSQQDILAAVVQKRADAEETLKKAMQQQNNVSEESLEKTLARIDAIQADINEIKTLQSELESLSAIEEKTPEQLYRESFIRSTLDHYEATGKTTKALYEEMEAVVASNNVFEENTKRLRENAEAERELADAATKRIMATGLSDIGEDVLEQFGGLMVDKVKEITDFNYSTDFLIQPEELQGVRDVADLYDIWAQNIKGVADKKKELAEVGISEDTLAAEQVKLDEKNLEIQNKLNDVNTRLNDARFVGQQTTYKTLLAELAQETTAEGQRKVQEKINKFLAKAENAEFRKLILRQANYKVMLKEATVAKAANEQVLNYLSGLDDLEKLWEELGKRYNFTLPDRNPGGGNGDDPWILLMKNRMKFMQDFQKGVENLSKWMGYTKGLFDEQENMLGRGLSLQIDSRTLNGTKEELIDWYEDAIEEIRKRIAKLGGKEWSGLGVQMILAKDTKSRVIKKYQELLADMFKELTDFRTEQTQKALEAKLKEIADGISRTKAAKEFFDKMLSMTGNENLAERLASSIFGQNGSALNREIANQLRTMVSETSVSLPDFVFYDDNSVNSKALRRWVYQNKEALGDVSKDLLKFADDAENNAAKQVEGWIKATEKAKEYGDKLADVYRTTNAEIKKIQTAIEHGTISKADGEELIANFERKRDEDVAKLQYEAFKDSPIYVQMFSDLDNASTSMLNHMKSSILRMQSQWSELNPTQLKELQSRLKEIDEQLTARNPFKTLADGMRDYIKLRTKGDARGNRSRGAADQDALNWTEKYLKAQEELAEIQNDPEATEAQLAGAAQMVTYTKQQKKEAEDCAARWDDVEAAIGMSVDKLLSTLNWAGDIAGAIADVSEVMGADEEDVQYWNDVADALGQISGGIQDIVKSAISGDVVGLISSVLTAAPKMFVGFVNLFSAGKVRKANKEIRRQAELLKDLEYAYSRLETAIDKAFGVNYLNTYQKQLKNLQAQQAAYEKQAAAERSKGKKEDKEKTEEYLNSARETADQIAEMQSQIAERMLGTDITSAAREFAQAWLDAYKEFGNTADAMSEKFNEMIQNMIIESVLAAAMEKALQPVFDMIDEMQTGDIYSKAFWNKLTDTTSQAAADADAAGKAVAAMFESMGLSIHDMTTTESTGIAKDISSATSEEINALAAIGNTLMYYVSPIPRMDENLAAIRSLLESGTTSQITTVEGGRWTDWQQQAMDNYNAIARNTADTVAECRRAAIACEAATDRLNRAFKTKGSRQGFSVFID